MWMHYHCRSFGLEYREYICMTQGEIEDMAMCRAIQNGAYDETAIPLDTAIPNLR